MRRRVGVLPVVAVLACLTLAFLWFSSQLDRSIADASRHYQQAVADGNSLETQQNALKSKLAGANTDAFIETQARTLYDYMRPDEIRFVITNPEALYGTDGTVQ
ncbi:MAG: hypothetical protein GX418_08680 [Clostridiales bacterium]|nr:hypothetical protein [Clostridiales bacterium]